MDWAPFFGALAGGLVTAIIGYPLALRQLRRQYAHERGLREREDLRSTCESVAASLWDLYTHGARVSTTYMSAGNNREAYVKVLPEAYDAINASEVVIARLALRLPEDDDALKCAQRARDLALDITSEVSLDVRLAGVQRPGEPGAHEFPLSKVMANRNALAESPAEFVGFARKRVAVADGTP